MPFTVLLESACCWHTHVKTPNCKNPKAEFFVLCRACAEFGANSGCVYVSVLKKTKQKKPTVAQTLKNLQVWHHTISLQEDEKIAQMRASPQQEVEAAGWGRGGGLCCTLHGSDPPPSSQWLRKAKPHLLKHFLPNFSPIEISSEMDMRP